MHAFRWTDGKISHLNEYPTDVNDPDSHRTLARRLRDEARLNVAGGRSPGPLLRLLSTPRAIWRACPALGSYFSVLFLLVGLAAVLSLVSIYPVVAATLQHSSDVRSYRCTAANTHA